MSISTLILLASLGPSKSLPVAGGGEQVVHYSAAPTQGDLVRQGLHPLVVLIRSDRHKAATIEGLYHGLGIGGFHRLELALPLDAPRARERIAQAVRYALKQPAVDPERVYLISAQELGVAAVAHAASTPDQVRGIVWLSPVLKAGKRSVLPLLSELTPQPILLTADVRHRTSTSAVSTLKTVLKMRFPDVRRIRRARLGTGFDQLSASATLTDQLVITLRTWAEKNCDRTAPKKKTLNEGCKK